MKREGVDFATAAVLLVGLYVVSELVSAGRGGRIATAVLVYTAAFFVLRGADVSVGVMRWGLGTVAFGMVVQTLSAATDLGWVRVVSSVVALGVALLAPFVVLRFIMRSGRVDLNVLAAGVVLYLLVGVLFGAVYTEIAWVDADAFTPPQPVAETGDSSLFYFSFVTLTTLGFGDIAAGSDVTRSLVVLEALTGQILLVVLIARLVSAFEPRRRGADS